MQRDKYDVDARRVQQQPPEAFTTQSSAARSVLDRAASFVNIFATSRPPAQRPSVTVDKTSGQFDIDFR